MSAGTIQGDSFRVLYESCVWQIQRAERIEPAPAPAYYHVVLECGHDTEVSASALRASMPCLMCLKAKLERHS